MIPAIRHHFGKPTAYAYLPFRLPKQKEPAIGGLISTGRLLQESDPPPLTEPERALGLHGKGIEQLERGNVFAARLLFEQAAKAGLAQSAVALGATYDPNELGKLNVVGFVPCVEAARIWYEKAQVLGTVEAAELLRRLGASSQHLGDRFVVVLASKKSRVDALNAFVELRLRYPAVLADQALDVQESNLGEKDISYRAVVGPSSLEAASSVCSKLITAGHAGCWVAAY